MGDLVQTIRNAGVVGAGGAGFPAHVKFGAKVDTVIANGAECEPLLRGDKLVLRHRTAEVLGGLTLLAQATGAKRTVLALKGHYRDLVQHVRAAAAKYPSIEIFELGNFYPAGDEQVIVHEVTGRIVPEGGIPLAVSCVVSNVVTLGQVARAAASGEPVTSRPVTIVGDVKRPRTVVLPIGTTVGDAVALAGGASSDDVAFVDGGPMMGAPVSDPDTPLTKRSGGLLVLSRSHPLVRRKSVPMERELRLAKSVCCQCRFCTDLCPRHLLGHAIRPHLVMRATNHEGFMKSPPEHTTSAYLCCLCGVCETYACPLGLSPRKVYAHTKDRLAKEKIANPHKRAVEAPNPARRGRLVPLPRLVARLGLSAYAEQGWDFDPEVAEVPRVRIPLLQHTGAPARLVVRPGVSVRRGDVVGEIPPGTLGARVHASIDGVVTKVEGGIVEIVRSQP